MKTTLLLLLPVAALAQETQLQVVDAGLHHAVWESVRTALDEAGQPVILTNSWTQLETGLNWWDESAGCWRETDPTFDLTADGHGVAQRGQHKLIVSPNLNTLGAVDIELPNGTRIRCNPAGISYYDSSSGKNVLLAEIKDCVGHLIAPNTIFFPDAFDTLSAGFRLVYTRAGVEADVVLFQDPGPPEAYDLDPETTTLCSYTEVWETPEPVAKGVVPDAGTGDTDPVFDFGGMQMVHGRAYLSHRQIESIGVNKVWQKLPDRRFLIEEVRYREVEPLLEKLQARLTVPDAALVAKRTTSGRGGPSALLSPRGSGRMLAGLRRSERDLGAGLILDFQLLNPGETNLVLNGTTTYHVTGLVNLVGTTTVEAGVVVKYANTNLAELRFAGGVVWEPTPYRPAVFTAVDDNSCGEVITGSTGSPAGTYAYCAVRFYTPPSALRIENARVKYANMGMVFYGTYPHELRHSQFVANSKAVYCSVSPVRLQNVLIDGCTSYALYPTGGGTMVGEHLTLKSCSAVAYASGVVTLTNSIFASVTNWATTFAGAYNKTNADLTVFQTVGAGSAYLSAVSSYRDAGTTNIDVRLLRDLRDRTTYPPVVLNADISSSAVLAPQAGRDTFLPDCGYHYDPLDWCWSGLNLTNATLTLTNGVAVGFYGPKGTILRTSSKFISNGRPDRLNRLVPYQTVQEQTLAWGSGTTFCLFELAASGPEVRLTLTDTAFLASASGRRQLFSGQGVYAVVPFAMTHSQLRGASMEFGNTTASMYNNYVIWTNNILHRCNLSWICGTQYNPPSLVSYNNLFWKGVNTFTVTATSAAWALKDNLFCSDTLTKTGAGTLTADYNGYRATLSALGGSNNKTGLTMDFQTGLATNLYGVLAGFYYPTNGASSSLTNLINTGSRTAASATLFHFTTTTNQVKEALSTVDIGYHLAAIDPTTGVLWDTDGDGIPDCLEDANGDGSPVGEPYSWTNYNSANRLSLPSSVLLFTPLK